MKKIFFIILTTALLGLALLSSAEEITLVADPWCPYTCNDNDSNPGYLIEIAKSVFKKANIEVIYKNIPWSRAIEETRNGNYDAVAGATKNDASDFIFPAVQEGYSAMRFWTKKDSKWTYKDIKSLKDIRLGAIRDYSYSSELDNYITIHEGDKEHIQLMSGMHGLEFNIKKLEDGKIDTFVEDINVLNLYFKNKKIENPYIIAGNPVMADSISDNYLYVAFGPNNPQAKAYAKQLNSGMLALRKSGGLQKILDKYGVKDWEQ